MPTGEIDLEMLSELHKKHPEVVVDNEVVEPSSQQLHNYKGTCSLTLYRMHFSAHEHCING